MYSLDVKTKTVCASLDHFDLVDKDLGVCVCVGSILVMNILEVVELGLCQQLF